MEEIDRLMKKSHDHEQTTGKLWADILKLRKDHDYNKMNKGQPDRYKTTWGNKTAVGLYHTIHRLIEDEKQSRKY